MATEWTPEELAALTCRVPGCTLLITLNNVYCDHHAEQLRKVRGRRPWRRAAPPHPAQRSRGC
jgi:hypothetical protein